MKRALKMFAVILWIFTAIVTGAYAINSLVAFYIIFGILNIVFSGCAAFYVVNKDLEIIKK